MAKSLFQRRSILKGGLVLLLRFPRTLLWTYLLNVAVAVLFSLRLNAELRSILDHSLEAQRLNSAFDLGVLGEVVHRLSYNAPSSGSTGYLGLPVYLIGYFFLVPGTLFCYRAQVPGYLAILLGTGVNYFLRFVRITLLTLLVSGVVLVPLLIAEAAWSAHVNDTVTGSAVWFYELPGLLLIFMVASALRLYFDLVEAYTVALGDRTLPDGKQDRRIRKTLLPAWHTLRRNFGRAYVSFVALTLLGFAIAAGAARLLTWQLPLPRAWPIFVIAQLGLFGMLATRFWQRGMETILVDDFPLPELSPIVWAEEPPQVVEEPVIAPSSLSFEHDPGPDKFGPN